MPDSPKSLGADVGYVLVFVTRAAREGGQIERLVRADGASIGGEIFAGEHPALAADRLALAARPLASLASDLFAYRKLATENTPRGLCHIFQVSPEAAWPAEFVAEDGEKYRWAPFTWTPV